jgi:DNA-binding NarL/FixJ family response regulator
MTNKSVFALIIAGPGTLQNGILALITTVPQINAALVAEDVSSALRMIENHQPRIIILDMSFPNVRDIVRQIKVQYPHIHLIVLAEDTSQEKESEALEADRVLIKGFSAKKLIVIVEKFLENTSHS